MKNSLNQNDLIQVLQDALKKYTINELLTFLKGSVRKWNLGIRPSPCLMCMVYDNDNDYCGPNCNKCLYDKMITDKERKIHFPCAMVRERFMSLPAYTKQRAKDYTFLWEFALCYFHNKELQ